MALINCPECKNTISSVAVSCPYCGVPLVCPECGRKHPPLEEPLPPNRQLRKGIPRLVAGLALIAVPLLASGLYWKIAHTESPVPPAPVPPVPAVAPPPTAAAPTLSETILRLAGSGVQGTRLAAALAEAYLKRGASEVWQVPVAAGQTAIQGRFPIDHSIKKIEISMQDPETVRINLAADQLDLGLFGKPDPEGFAKPRSPDGVAPVFEARALAADGIAVIVGRDNPVPALSRDQIAAIFGGIITDWRQVKQKPGPIKVYIPEEGAEGGDTFRSLLPGPPAAGAAAHAQPAHIAETVAKDANAIGAVAMPYVGEAKAVPIAEIGSGRAFPTASNVALGVYPLASRLYLYSLKGSENPKVKEFVDFAVSPAGQEVIRRSGLVALNGWTGAGDAAGAEVGEYALLTADALHLSFDLHFPAGSGELGEAARTNLLRATAFLKEIGPENFTLLVFGFSDSQGNPASHPRVSLLRAQRAASELKRYGIVPAVVRGVGSAKPVASNDTEAGRYRNRRVELWLKRENRSMAGSQPQRP